MYRVVSVCRASVSLLMYKLTPTLQIMYRFTPTIHIHTTDSTTHVQTSTSIGSTHSNHPHSLSPAASSRARATAERDRHGFPSLCRTAADPLVPTSPRARLPRQPHRRAAPPSVLPCPRHRERGFRGCPAAVPHHRRSSHARAAVERSRRGCPVAGPPVLAPPCRTAVGPPMPTLPLPRPAGVPTGEGGRSKS